VSNVTPLFPPYGEDTPANTLRAPPQNVLAEQALLGGVLSNNRALTAIEQFLKPEHFIDPVNARIYKVIQRLVAQGSIADPITLKGDLENSGVLDDCGGTEYLAALISGTVSIANATDYARVIRDAWIRRSMVDGLAAVTELCYAPPDGGVAEIVAQAEILMAIVGENAGSAIERRGQLLDAALDEALAHADRASRGEITPGRSTGMASIDEAIGGLEDSTLFVLAGRPGSGKSALGMQIAVAVARACQEQIVAGGDPAGVGIFSLEMSAMALGRRALAEVSRVSVRDLKRGNIEGKTENLARARKHLAGLPLLIEDAGGQRLTAIRRKCRAMQRRWGRIALILVDHMHIVVAEEEDRRNGSTQAIEHISGTLRDMSKEFRCPVLALAQLSRALLSRDDKRPNLGDLRQSGAIEQDADIVAFVHREEMFLGKGEPPQTESGSMPGAIK
jgi:replicative DNA helicase